MTFIRAFRVIIRKHFEEWLASGDDAYHMAKHEDPDYEHYNDEQDGRVSTCSNPGDTYVRINAIYYSKNKLNIYLLTIGSSSGHLFDRTFLFWQRGWTEETNAKIIWSYKMLLKLKNITSSRVL